MISSLVIKRAYSGQLKSVIVTKSKTFIGGVDELYGKLDKIKPYMVSSNSQTISKLMSLNDKKWNTILSKRTKLSSYLEVLMKLNDILEGRAVLISDTLRINDLIKIHPHKDLKMTKVKIQNSTLYSRRFRYPISKDSSKFEKLYRT